MVQSGEKRGAGRPEELMQNIKCVLLDIEGTTTSISFVKDVLFTYVRDNLKKYVDEKWNDDEFKADLEQLKEQAKQQEQKKENEGFEIVADTDDEFKSSVIKNVLWQMDLDMKTGALKSLQGHMWRDAYNSGLVKGHVYEDVPKAFEEWASQGIKIYIYSSGSEEAQKLLFANSDHGDLSKFITEYFDTKVGPKQEPDSYKTIVSKIEQEASSILFLTDILKEAEAAKSAGLTAAILSRPGNAPIVEEDKITFTVLDSFTELHAQVTNKRQKLDESTTDSQKSKDLNNDKDIIQEKNVTEPEAPVESMDTSDVAVETTAEKVESKVEENQQKENASNGKAPNQTDVEVKITEIKEITNEEEIKMKTTEDSVKEVAEKESISEPKEVENVKVVESEKKESAEIKNTEVISQKSSEQSAEVEMKEVASTEKSLQETSDETTIESSETVQNGKMETESEKLPNVENENLTNEIEKADESMEAEIQKTAEVIKEADRIIEEKQNTSLSCNVKDNLELEKLEDLQKISDSNAEKVVEELKESEEKDKIEMQEEKLDKVEEKSEIKADASAESKVKQTETEKDLNTHVDNKNVEEESKKSVISDVSKEVAENKVVNGSSKSEIVKTDKSSADFLNGKDTHTNGIGDDDKKAENGTAEQDKNEEIKVKKVLENSTTDGISLENDATPPVLSATS